MFKFKKASSGVWLCNKPVSKTPLEAALELKRRKPVLKNTPITYAGRLDPMAEGLLILLSGQKVHEKQKFLNLNKTYEAKILFGASSDSFDLLGLPKISKKPLPKVELLKKLVSTKLTGQVTFKLPKFSSPPLLGKPLHLWARSKQNFKTPTRTTTVYEAKVGKTYKTSKKEILQYLNSHIPNVNGDFRQAKILKAWISALSKTTRSFLLLELEVHCQSGTYVRSLTQNLSTAANCPSLLFALNRTKIGPYTLSEKL